MSSVEVKEQVNRYCRLARSFKELKTLCSSANINAMQINNAIQSARFNVGEPTSMVLVDLEELDRLKNENQEMQMLLSDYHRGVELLMDAYRKRVMGDEIAGDGHSSTRPTEECFDRNLLDTVIKQGNQISEMQNVMKKSAKNSDTIENEMTERIAYLLKENAVLRELYEISVKFGSTDLTKCEDKMNVKDSFCQTDDPVECSDSDEYTDEEDAITVISLKFDESDSSDDDESKEILKSPDQDNAKIGESDSTDV